MTPEQEPGAAASASSGPAAATQYADRRDMEEFWRELRPESEPLHTRWFLPAVVVLLLLNIPWYLPHTIAGQLAGGLPVYAWIALVTSVGLAAVTSCALLGAWRDRVEWGEERAVGSPGDTGADAGKRP